MKRNTYLYIVVLSVLFLSYGCKKDQFYLFNSEARIQFGPPIIPGRVVNEYTDSLKSETFYYTPEFIKQDTIYFDVYTIGAVEKQDRSYKLRQINVSGVDNAQPGKHYIAFDNSSLAPHYVIKADSVHARVPVVVLRDEELKGKTVTLSFELLANDQFALGEPTKLKRKLEFTDRLSKPNAWTASFTQYYFGAYSVRKHAFMIETTGEKWDQSFIANLPIDQNNYFKSVLAMALIDYNKQHPGAPLRDEKGELITFPN